MYTLCFWNAKKERLQARNEKLKVISNLWREFGFMTFSYIAEYHRPLGSMGNWVCLLDIIQTFLKANSIWISRYFKLCHYYYYLYMLDIHSTQLHTCHKLEMHHTQQNILNILVLSHDHCKNIVHYDHTSDQLIHPHHRHSLKQVMIFSKI